MNRQQSHSHHNIVLKKREDQVTKQFKQIALIHNGDFKRALDLLSTSSNDDQLFYRAYCLYRLNQSSEALSTLNKCNHDQQLVNHLKAQIEYKIGKYNNSSQLYETMIREDRELEEDEEFLTNLSAAYTLGQDYEKALSTCNKGDSYSLAYNAACASISLKKYDQALSQLAEAARKCRQALKEEGETSEEAINNELAAIVVQTAYVKQLTGDIEGALAVYNEILKNKPSDKVAVAVAATNLISIHASASDREQKHVVADEEKIDLFDALKKLKLATQEKVKEKLTTEQQRGVDLNFALLHLHMNKLVECRHEVERLSQIMPESDIPVLLQSALLLKEKKPAQAIETLEKYIENNKDNHRAKLSLAQIRLNRGEWAEAADALQKTSINNEPSIVRLCTELYQKVGDSKSSLNVLNNAISYWNKQYEVKKDEETKSRVVQLLVASAKLQEEQRKHKEAASTYKMLADLDSKNKSEYVARIVNALSFFDMEEAEKHLNQLPAIPTSHLNVAELEANKTNPFGEYVQRTNKTIAAAAVATTTTTDQDLKKKKKRRNKPPKNPATANKESDRWISKKKKKVLPKSAATGFGTQGSDQSNPSLLHEKGHKTIHRPDQVHGTSSNVRKTPKGVVTKKAPAKKGKR
jgi:signal recognition particle subunit SRP72